MKGIKYWSPTVWNKNWKKRRRRRKEKEKEGAISEQRGTTERNYTTAPRSLTLERLICAVGLYGPMHIILRPMGYRMVVPQQSEVVAREPSVPRHVELFEFFFGDSDVGYTNLAHLHQHRVDELGLSV